MDPFDSYSRKKVKRERRALAEQLRIQIETLEWACFILTEEGFTEASERLKKVMERKQDRFSALLSDPEHWR